MNDAVNTASLVTQIVSTGGLGIFAYLVYRLLERFLDAQAKRDEAATMAAAKRDEAQAARDATISRFMGLMEERTRHLEIDDEPRRRVRTSPFGMPTRRRSPADTEAEDE